MGTLGKIYDKSPIFFQNIMCSAKGFQQHRERYGKNYWEYRDYFKKFDALPLNEQEELQISKLRELIKYAVEKSEFYRDLYQGINIDSIRSIDDLKQLPVVDKETLRSHIDTVMTIPEKGAVIQHTGGTTGKSLIVRMTADDMNQRMAMLDNFKARVGFEHLKMRRATFNGKHIVPPNQKKKVFWRYNAACKQMIYSSFHLTEENMGAYVESLNKFQPIALDGFFTSVCDLASYIERKGITIKFHPIAIFPTSETLTSSGRELLERVFGCKVYDQYASSEGAPFVTECVNQVLHMELASGVFEHIDESETEVLVTSFTTHGTPLIRYRIGDRMRFPSLKKCNCGLCGPIVDEIQGRQLDFLYTADGAKINAGNVANLLKNIPNAVIRAQFIQKRMDEITVLLEVEKGVYNKKHEELLLDEFEHKFGKSMKINIKIVDNILRESSGKFRMIRNEVQ
ncbi:hypothetical protein ABXS75_00485 [Roseburia hominis]